MEANLLSYEKKTIMIKEDSYDKMNLFWWDKTLMIRLDSSISDEIQPPPYDETRLLYQ